VGEQTPDFAVGGIVPETTRWRIVGTDGPEAVVPLGLIQSNRGRIVPGVTAGRFTAQVPLTSSLRGLLTPRWIGVCCGCPRCRAHQRRMHQQYRARQIARRARRRRTR
jgi:hypothetical protein